MAVRYKNGLKLEKVTCHRCGGRQDGVVHRSGPRWEIWLHCGHVKIAGYTKPVEVLRQKGMITTETPVDPRHAVAKELEQDDRLLEYQERVDYSRKMEGFAGRSSFF